MDMEISLPNAIPVMTLPDTVLFPQALLPLHIFEPRYQQMLRDVLATHRMFAAEKIGWARYLEEINSRPSLLAEPAPLALRERPEKDYNSR